MYFWHSVILFSFASAFLFFWGAAIGSFLNVVIYRLPAGLNLMRPGSRCPACEHPIRARDNVPVLGWLILRGRCRDCGVRIPLRYPMVELSVGLFFLGLGHWELLSGGSNLPLVRAGYGYSFDLVQWFWHWPLTGIFGYHCLLFCCLLTAGMIRQDGNRLPIRLMRTTLALGLVLAVFGPELRPAPASFPWVLNRSDWWSGALDGLSGVFTGWVLGMVLRSASIGELRRQATPDLEFALAAVGAYLGWQAALGVAAASPWLMLMALQLKVPKRTVSLAAVGILAVVQVVFWKHLWSIPFWPGASPRPWGYLVAGAAMLIGCLLIRFSSRAREEERA